MDHMIHNHEYLKKVERELRDIGLKMIERKADLDRREGEIERKELITNLAPIFEREQTKAQPPAQSTSTLPPPRPRTRYVKEGGGQEYNAKTGDWVERDQEYWASVARHGGATLLEVYDLPGLTVVDNPTYGEVVVRGCAVCGVGDVVRPRTPIRFANWWGSFCIEHHTIWERLDIHDKKSPGLFVTRALRKAGYIDPSVPVATVIKHSHDYREEVPNVLKPWKPFTWAGRVMKSKAPETQEPMSQPFGFLSGPIRVAVKEEPDG